MHWISVKDRLPDQSCDIIGFEKDIVYSGFYSVELGFFDIAEETNRKNTTHWMPFPDPPGESKCCKYIYLR
jgi:hypothetical protein